MKATSFAFPLLAATGWLSGCLPGGSDSGARDTGTDDAVAGGDAAAATADAMPGLPDAPTGAPDAAAPMFHGSPPLTPKPLPMFSVLNRDGTVRTEADLMGHPTVIWFYPAAFTSG